MAYTHFDRQIDEPDVVVRVYPEDGGLPPAAVLSIECVSFSVNSLTHSLESQLGQFERIGQRILDAVKGARPDIPRSAA
jgi:hypothetical protein